MMNILWLSWKDITHPQAGGAEVVGHELRSRLLAEGHAITHLTARYAQSKERDTTFGYETIRVGNRLSVYWKAYRYYRRNLAGSFDIVIDEINTIPFFASLYTKNGDEKKRKTTDEKRSTKNNPCRVFLFVHQLCREIWFYQMPFPLSWAGYLLEPWYLRVLSRRGHRVITVSESTAHDLTRYGFQRYDISIISEGTHLPPLTRLEPKPDGNPVLLALGSVRPMKRTLHILRAFELAKAKLPDLTLTIAGDISGPYGSAVRHRVEKSPYYADIRILGTIAKEEKARLLQNAHLLAAASVKEGWGLVITEAASQGTPAVAYDADGLRDSIRDGMTGTLAPENTPEGLAGAIVETLRDTDRYETLRKNAWEWSKEITFAKCADGFKKATEIRNKPDQNPESLKDLQKR